MIQAAVCLRKGLILAGGLLLLPLGLVFLLLLAILIRPLILTAALVAVLLYLASPTFRGWLDAKIDTQVLYQGLR